MSTFEITSVDPDTYTWQTKDGQRTFVAYKVGFSGDEGKGEAELSKLPTSAPPRVGEVGEFELINTPGCPARLKKLGGPGSSSNGGGKSGRTYGKSPEERAQIARMNAHGHALKYWEMKYAADTSFRIASWEDYLKVVELFYADVKAAA